MSEYKNPNGEKDNAYGTDYVVGRNAVLEVLKAGKEIDAVFVLKGERKGSIIRIISLCKEKGIPVKDADEQKLNMLAQGGAHQGVAAACSATTYVSVEDILEIARQRNQPPFLIIADSIEDPHNLGAIIRTAEACGVHGIIIPKRRSVGTNATVHKTSAGALAHMAVARVSNLTSTITRLKEQGVWIYAADASGQLYCKTDFKGPVALVIGSEGEGISRLVLEQCDFKVALFMQGQINSLNASVAAGVLMYEIARQRLSL